MASTEALAAPPATPRGHPSVAGSYLVRATPGQLDAVAARLRGKHVHLGLRIPLIDAVTASLRTGQADALRAGAGVLSVTPNAAVHLMTTTYVAGQDVNSMYSLGNMIGSRGWWNKYTGAGIDVALIDSGVAPVAGLSDAGKIVNGPDLTPESQNPSTRYLDTYGHGTHLAGIIAGHDTGIAPATNAGNSTAFLGVAPDARIVSVKVADAHGNTDVSQVIAAIGWVVQHAHDPGMNIRVLNLSFGTDSAQDYSLDPLSYAAEVAWRAGIVVVTSAGNSGATDGRLTDPANDPYVLAVGADDLNGTPSITDDTVPLFSSHGDGKRNPDIVAPGAHLQSLRVPGSYVDTQHAATGAIDGRFFRGSGTSQAAAFASGCVALLLQRSPTFTPDMVKALLMSTTSVLPKADATAQGTGLINMRNVLGAKLPGPSPQKWVASTGTGSLDGSRGSAHLAMDGVTLSGEVDLNGMPYNSAAMAAALANGTSWVGGTWNGSAWAGSAWAGKSWAGAVWAGKSWAGSAWAGKSWATGSWAGSAWASANWAGATWAGSAWAGKSWAGKSWADADWS